MKTDAFVREVVIFRNRGIEDYRPFEAVLADANPEGQVPRWEKVEWIKVYPEHTEIFVYDVNRPIYYKLPDGTRRKVIYPKKSRTLEEVNDPR